jgi:hypothetical protein
MSIRARQRSGADTAPPIPFQPSPLFPMKNTFRSCLPLLLVALCAFVPLADEAEFEYPDSDVAVTMSLPGFEDFKEEWRGEDYYYFGTRESDGMVCSLLYYKLNESEKKSMAKLAEKVPPENRSKLAQLHFRLSNKLAKLESGETTWDENGFSFRDVNIDSFQGQDLRQKNMCAYQMYGDDLFLMVHFSKVLYTPEDSVAMRTMLTSIRTVKD